MKRQLTPEQQTARDARRANFRALVQRIGKMTDQEKAEMTSRLGAIPTAGGGAITGLTNTMLLIMQLPQVTMVGGFRQWLKAGRAVKKGEHGAMIWVPTGPRQETVMQEASQGGEPDEKHFITGTVFDISQTMEIEAGQPAESEAA
jgi:hypothetical protein